jgi:hypothetical protein
MAGLVPAIPMVGHRARPNRDPRDKPAGDTGVVASIVTNLIDPISYCASMLAGNNSSSFITRGVNPCSFEYCAMVSSTRRLARTP